MLEDTLIELVEYVRGEDAMDVGIWEILPEWRINTTCDILLQALLGELIC